MISGLERPTSGEIYFDERPITRRAGEPQRRLRVPELRDLHAHAGLRQSGLRAARAKAEAAEEELDPRSACGRDRRSHGRTRPQCGAPVRERHAEGRARPQHDRQPRDLPTRRAVLEPRCSLSRLYAYRVEAYPGRGRSDDGLRHPRPGRGDEHGRPHRRDGSGVLQQYGRRRRSTTRRRTGSWRASWVDADELPAASVRPSSGRPRTALRA